MKTKQEYIDALNRMVEVYDNLDGCMSAINIFNESVHLLEGLVNEHFEEKSETNYEHYKDEIIKDSCFVFALVDGKPHKCSSIKCNKCGFSTGHGCNEKIKEWLKSPYKPIYKLTKFEYDLLRVHKDYKTYNNIANQIHLFKMREKGYFKDVDTNIPIREILDNCEVIKR